MPEPTTRAELPFSPLTRDTLRALAYTESIAVVSLVACGAPGPRDVAAAQRAKAIHDAYLDRLAGDVDASAREVRGLRSVA